MDFTFIDICAVINTITRVLNLVKNIFSKKKRTVSGTDSSFSCEIHISYNKNK